MCLWNTDAPGGNKVKLWHKISKSYIFTPPHPKGHVMSVNWMEPLDMLDELTVQVGYCMTTQILNIALCF